ncbi:hypothetical protein GGU11DRAFT_760269, partial [Lentinula aff. detonsa]
MNTQLHGSQNSQIEFRLLNVFTSNVYSLIHTASYELLVAFTTPSSCAGVHFPHHLNSIRWFLKVACYVQPLYSFVVVFVIHGLVGARWPEHGVFVTSPNMKVLSPPLLGPQKIRERLQYHFGEHDPCLVAQPFDASTAFLSVIQYPYGVNASSLILWAVPDRIEFEPVLGQTLAQNPLGHLKRQLVDELESYYLILWSDCSTALPASSDVSESSAQSSLSRARPKLNDYQTRIRILLSQLKRPLLFNEAIHSWVCAQRNILQMEALYTWVTSVEPRWDTPSPIAKHAIRDVVGALTERADEAEKLFR